MKITTFALILIVCFSLFPSYGRERTNTLLDESPYFSYSEPKGFCTVFTSDVKGRVWIGYADALACYNGAYYLVFNEIGEGSPMVSSYVNDLAFDSEGTLWIADNRGCQYYQNGVFHDVSSPSMKDCGRVMELVDGQMLATCMAGLVKIDKEGILDRFYRKGLSFTKSLAVSANQEIWISTQSTLDCAIYVLEADFEVLEEIPLGTNVVVEDFTIMDNGELWVLTNHGLRIFDTDTRKEKPVSAFLENIFTEQALFARNWSSDEILVGIHGKGLMVVEPYKERVRRIFSQEKLMESDYTCYVTPTKGIWLSGDSQCTEYYSTQGSAQNLISSICPEHFPSSTFIQADSNGRIWMIRGGLLTGYDPAEDRIIDEIIEDTAFADIFIGNKDRLSVIYGRTEVRWYDVSEGRLAYICSKSYPEESIISISEDRKGNMWIFLDKSIRVLSPNGQKELVIRKRPWVLHTVVMERPQRRMYVFGDDGNCYLCEDTLTLLDRPPIPEDIPEPRTMLRSKNGDIWVGTMSDGLYRVSEKNGTIDHYDIYNGLPDNQVRDVLEDNNGNIWISTRSQITKFDTSSSIFYSLHGSGFSSLRSYSRENGAVGNDGRVFFAGEGGLSYVDEDWEFQNKYPDAAEIDFVSVNGIPMREIPKKLNLTSSQNTIWICYASSDCEGTSNLSYAVMLKGLDKDWNYTKGNEAYYHSLRPGKYTFSVKTRIGNGSLEGETASVSIKIARPLLLSTAAQIVYLLLAGMLAFGFSQRKKREKEQRELLKIAEEGERQKQERLDFLTNVAHEFKTPLTMVYGPVEQLYRDTSFGKEEKTILSVARNATLRLRSLLDQILNVSAFDDAREVLRVSETDLVALVGYIIENYRYSFKEKSIELDKSLLSCLVGWADEDKIFKILSNLLSNAVKYVPEGGKVVVRMDTEGHNAVISVEDNGPGIPAGMEEKIFERFERIGAEKTRLEGIGVGLNYARYLANLHNGNLSYKPTAEGGSCFILSFPIISEYYDDEAKIIRESTIDLLSKDIPPKEEIDVSRKTVLVVEDNLEIRLYLRYLMKDKYNVLMATDGEAAMHVVRSIVPDLIVSDLVMSEMDGMKLCASIKGDPDLHHIAFLILTAKKDRESNLKGLENGADAYLSKPFDPAILLAEVKSLLRNREIMQKGIMSLSAARLKSEDVPSLGERDRDFLIAMQEKIEANLGNEKFSIEGLARDLCVSYSSLYARTKTLTGLTPQAFLVRKRMEKAKVLLLDGNYSITDIAEAVGYASLSNFSREFKKAFGIQPSNFAKR